MSRYLSLFALAIAFLATPARAGEDNAITSLRAAQISVYAIIREFHMLTILTGDAGRAAQLKSAVSTTGGLLSGIDGNGNAAIEAAANEARALWPAFTKLALANNIATDGYTDDNLIGELYTAAEPLEAALDKAIKAVPPGKKRALADRLHGTNRLLQRTVASYLKRGAQMSPDVGAVEDFDIGEATKNLDREMIALSRELKADPAMAGVYSKWNFIRGRLANYNEKSVPYIVDRYAGQINEGMQAMIRGLDAQ